MVKKSILAELIESAVTCCYETGEGVREYDEEIGVHVTAENDASRKLGLRVTAEWTESGDPEYPSIINICIFQDGVLKLSYKDPTTKCK